MTIKTYRLDNLIPDPAEDTASVLNYHHKMRKLTAERSMWHGEDAGHILMQMDKALGPEGLKKWVAENLKMSQEEAEQYIDLAKIKEARIQREKAELS